jgi:hypothetical protein
MSYNSGVPSVLVCDVRSHPQGEQSRQWLEPGKTRLSGKVPTETSKGYAECNGGQNYKREASATQTADTTATAFS